MSRPHVEFVQSFEIAADEVPSGPFAGLPRRLLSEDDETGASTALVTVPAGSEVDVAGFERPLELFALSAAGTIAGRAARAGTYAYLPPESADASVAMSTEALVLVMTEAAAPGRGEDLLVVDTEELRWEERSIAA